MRGADQNLCWMASCIKRERLLWRERVTFTRGRLRPGLRVFSTFSTWLPPPSFLRAFRRPMQRRCRVLSNPWLRLFPHSGITPMAEMQNTARNGMQFSRRIFPRVVQTILAGNKRNAKPLGHVITGLAGAHEGGQFFIIFGIAPTKIIQNRCSVRR